MRKTLHAPHPPVSLINERLKNSFENLKQDIRYVMYALVGLTCAIIILGVIVLLK